MTTADIAVNHEVAKNLGLLPEEFDRICEILGRTPNFTELSIFSVMWSEHCSYKNSIVWLKTLPRSGGKLLVGAGEENAGLVDIGDGWACAFKIESHNHPSALEPFQGAATGVGGIHRDIFTMGARPIAALNSLRFGDLDLPHTRHLLRGVVKGISHYGNCFGVPTVGGEVYFNSCYNQNILVNAMSVGVVEVGKTISACADGPGNPVFIVGSATGKDGIHGATFASADLNEDSAEDLPAVQVGDPFQEKLLLEASLEAIATGAVVGMQDMGAAGIICSTSEMSAKSGTGMRINLDKVPLRQSNMHAWEILLSESQERMLIVCHKGQEDKLLQVFDKWDLECEIIGEVTDTGQLEFMHHGELVAHVPSEPLVLGGGAPQYHREYTRPQYLDQLQDSSGIGEPENLEAAARKLFASPNLVSRRWVYEQYDSMVRTNTMTTNVPADAAVIRVKGTDKSLVVTTDCNSRYVHANPYKGAQMAVAEAARNIVCTGGVPLAVTNNLNFGNPYNPEVYWQFVEAVKGMGDACSAFETPVTGGNVSFYNQSQVGNTTVPIYPTPTIGMLGMLENESHLTSLAFDAPGDSIYLLGEWSEDINASEFLSVFHGQELSPAPEFDLEKELLFQRHLIALIRTGHVSSMHDCSEGGVFGAVLESAMAAGLGFELSTPEGKPASRLLFSETPGRVILSVKPGNAAALEDWCKANQLTAARIGQVKEETVAVNGATWGTIHSWKSTHDQMLAQVMDNLDDLDA